jgi:hypothetical protein
VIDQLTVRWPSGKVSTLEDVKADQILSPHISPTGGNQAAS